jgi:hypothetical protein
MAVLAKKRGYGYKLTDAGRAEDGAALLTSTTVWWEDEVKRVL